MPVPGPGELLIRVLACAVCRTDLHVVEEDLPPHKTPVTPGHEVVGVVEETGQKVGVAWLRYTCGHCRFCTSGAENLCPYSRYTGWDDDGGYAEYTVAPADYVYELPDGYTDAQLAPLLCAGIIGYRALRRSRLPAGGRLGVYGFGASAHLAAQIALAEGARVHVFTRTEAARALAVELGASSANDAYAQPPEPLDAAILFAPVGDLVPVALEGLDRGGTLAVAGIHLSEIPPLDYGRHLFQERELRSVTANTREDGRELLRLGLEIPIRTSVHRYPLDRANQALQDLKHDRIRGAAVLVP